MNMAMPLSDKLTLLRLQNGLSKAELSNRLGVSESDISAWESGASSPDLNVLPKIASFYSITVDALLNPEHVPNNAPQQQTYQQPNYQQPNCRPNYQQPNYQQQNTNAQQDYTQQAKQAAKGFIFSRLFEFADSCVKTANHRATARMMFIFPFPLIIVAAYIFVGAVLDLWHPAWIMFLLIPCYYMIAAALRAKSRKAFFLIQPVPIVVVILFLMIGFGLHIWHPTWILFLIIPAYYWFVAVFVKGRRR